MSENKHFKMSGVRGFYSVCSLIVIGTTFRCHNIFPPKYRRNAGFISYSELGDIETLSCTDRRNDYCSWVKVIHGYFALMLYARNCPQPNVI